MREFNLHDGKSGAAITVRVTPRARRTEFVGIEENGTLRIRIAGSTISDDINRQLESFISAVLDVDTERVDIVAGESGLDKLVSVIALSTEEVEKRVHRWMETNEIEDEDAA